MGTTYREKLVDEIAEREITMRLGIYLETNEAEREKKLCVWEVTVFFHSVYLLVVLPPLTFGKVVR